ncbi:MAG: 4Fe-4S dicluster domain-containing protein [Eggerthellaceae bacterium]|nr:4Fe-4S dicluster domain-containing protein [Eggerthellaceae bacterium]
MADKAILYDSSKCTACKGCQVACKTWNDLPSPLGLNENKFTGSYQSPLDVGGQTRMIITFDERKATEPRKTSSGEDVPVRSVEWAFGRRSCMHCTDAGCVNVCPSGALFHIEETGMVSFDASVCIGCQYCRSACPYDIPRHSDDGINGSGLRINKCTGCPDRVAQGRKPACVHTCQPNALMFGDRDEMLEYAHERVETLKARGYSDARVYGETEMDGAHTLHVLKYSLDHYTLPEHPAHGALDGALDFMKPLAAVGGIGILGGLTLSYLTGLGYKRDDLVYDEKNKNVIDKKTGEVVKHIEDEQLEKAGE